MSVPVIAFFSNKGGIGTTSLVYHLAWMFSDLQVKVLAVDLDPQANLTSAFDKSTPQSRHVVTVFESIQTILHGTGGTLGIPIGDDLILMPSDLLLSGIEEDLAVEWQAALEGKRPAILSALWQALENEARNYEVQLVLVDLGPNLGAINRAGLLTADYIVLPVAPDQFSVLGMKVLGETLRKWREDWRTRLHGGQLNNMDLPAGKMTPLGYVVLQPGVAITGENWIKRIPDRYWESVLGAPPPGTIFNDPARLAILKPYRSLLAMAQEARKPMFHLKPADGAIGAHLQSAEDARKDFEALAKAIATKAGLPIAFAS